MFKTVMATFDVLAETPEQRLSRRVGRDEVGGLTISTVYTSDAGYETAVIDSAGAHPVERYESRDLAAIGHLDWCERAPGLVEVDKLGDADGWLETRTITLVR